VIWTPCIGIFRFRLLRDRIALHRVFHHGKNLFNEVAAASAVSDHDAGNVRRRFTVPA
jgi:hypothetical protein